MLDHANLTAMVGMITDALELTGADHSLLILPLFHVNGIVVSVLSPLAVGGTHDHHRPLLAVDVLRHRRSGPPHLLLGGARHLRHAERPSRTTSARTPRRPVRGVRRRAHAGRADRPLRGPLRHCHRRGLRTLRGLLRVDDQPHPRPAQARDGRAAAARPGGRPARRRTARPTTDGRGEVIVRGPNVMRGYLNQPEDDRTGPARADGCTPATSDTSTTTATWSWSTGSRT